MAGKTKRTTSRKRSSHTGRAEMNYPFIYKGPLLVIVPPSMQAEMLNTLHANHLGTEPNTRMAREVLYWPGMRKGIKDMCDACPACAQYNQLSQCGHSRHPVYRGRGLLKQSFTLNQKNYLVILCHYSDWIEIDPLTDTLATTIITKTNVHMAHFGIPKNCHPDNVQQYCSQDYKDFALSYGFQHTTSSPYYPNLLCRIRNTATVQ